MIFVLLFLFIPDKLGAGKDLHLRITKKKFCELKYFSVYFIGFTLILEHVSHEIHCFKSVVSYIHSYGLPPPPPPLPESASL